MNSQHGDKNYKLQKTMAKASAEEEIDLINSYTKSGSFLPIDEYGI
jgi:hypothetical protein